MVELAEVPLNLSSCLEILPGVKIALLQQGVIGSDLFQVTASDGLVETLSRISQPTSGVQRRFDRWIEAGPHGEFRRIFRIGSFHSNKINVSHLCNELSTSATLQEKPVGVIPLRSEVEIHLWKLNVSQSNQSEAQRAKS